MSDSEELQTLCNALNEINEEFKLIEAEQKSDFNIFTILRNKNEEVALHSRFIAELLNPKSSHKLPIFQQLFIEYVVNPQSELNPIPATEVFSCDYEVGVSFGESKLGRIDICLRSQNYAIVIENKIHASDQKDQLERYYKAAQKWVRPENIRVLYLNLDGHPVSDSGRGNLSDNDYGIISYEMEIMAWLEKCLEQISIAHLHATIYQYKQLIASLTGQTLRKEHQLKINELLQSGNNFELVLKASKQLESIQIATQKLVWQELHNFLSAQGFDFKFTNSKFEKSFSFEDFTTIHVDNYYKFKNRHKYYGIQYQIEAFNEYSIHLYVEINQRLYYGFTAARNNKREPLVETLSEIKSKVAQLNLPSEIRDSKWFFEGILLPANIVNFWKVDAGDTCFSSLVNPDKRKEWIENTGKEIITAIKSYLNSNGTVARH